MQLLHYYDRKTVRSRVMEIRSGGRETGRGPPRSEIGRETSISSFAALSDRFRLAATLDFTMLMLYVLFRRVASRASRLSLPRRA